MILSWHSLNLGDAMLAGPAIDDVERQFNLAYEQAGCPKGMAVFIRHESEGRLHCDVIAYFSPDSSGIAKTLDARVCSAPSRHSLSLLAGSNEARKLIFGE